MIVQSSTDASEYFWTLTGHPPMHWQMRLLQQLRDGQMPDAVDLPTGLGKTAIMAIWLIARAFPNGTTSLPRRLIYVVDRRAVVDQATKDAERLTTALAPGSDSARAQEMRAGLGLAADAALPVSTLRGALADNGAWLRDPATPAIIVGTVDMIGSRLLFEGYGVSRRMRPLHAGLLGLDTLVVLDEAHLVPPFEALLRQVAAEESSYGAAGDGAGIPRLRLITLSATMRSGDAAFRLTADDEQDAVAQRRIGALKSLRLAGEHVPRKELATKLAERAWTLATDGGAASRVVVFCDRREDAGKVADRLRERADKPPCELLVGERRVRERQRVAEWIERHGFQPGATSVVPGPAFLVATAAGEVGVDLDAEHMVADLVEWERMVQRLGRVNRRGEGDARVEILRVAEEKPAAPSERERRAAKSAGLLTRLPAQDAGGRDASPRALMALRAEAGCAELLAAASTPAPLRPALTRALVEAWSLTSLEEHTGRPEIGPWLRGWAEEEPQASLIWRRFLPWRSGARPGKAEVDAYFEHAPPEREEALEAPVWRALEVLRARAESLLKRASGLAEAPALLVLTPALALEDGLTIAQLRDFNQKDAVRRLADRILVVAASLGGLSADGLLDEAAAGAVAEAEDAAAETSAAAVTQDGPQGMAWDRLRILRQTAGKRPEPVPEGWTLAHAWASRLDEDGEPAEEIGIWTLEAARAEPGLTRAGPQSLANHSAAVVACAKRLADRLGLDPDHGTMLAVAARLHDAGKASDSWQDAFGAPREGRPYAKTAARWINQALLDGYRHEFGSLRAAADDPGLRALPPELQDLALHLIVAHHGHGRPLIHHGGDIERAGEVALRFARLQRRWAPWGLAWWEALLRAADAQASRRHEEGIG